MLACQALGSQVLACQALGSQVLEYQALGSQVLECQVLGSQGPCLQLQLLKQQPRQPSTGPEVVWELAAFPLSEWVPGAFLALVSESEVFLELPFPLQLRQPPLPRQPSSVLQEQEPWVGWCQVPKEQYQVCPVLEQCQG